MATAAMAQTSKEVATMEAVGLAKVIKTEAVTTETKTEAAMAVAAASKSTAAETGGSRLARQ